jgi:molybdate transport system substrate-binding protein
MRLVKHAKAFCALGALLFFLTDCRRATNENSRAKADEITVAAAANLSEVFKKMADRFTAQTGIKVTCSFGATANLAKQIEQGAPFDVFAAADTEHVTELNRKGFIVPDTQKIYARGQLVLWLAPDSNLKIESIEDLARDDVQKAIRHLAVAQPDSAPYGRAAVETLRALNLWDKYASKIVYAPNVADAKQFAQSGNADAAFIPLALIKENERRAIGIDEKLYQPILQAIGVVKSSTKQTAARLFVDFVTSSEGRAMLSSYGYKSVN